MLSYRRETALWGALYTVFQKCFKNGPQKQKFPIWKIPIQNDRVYAPHGSQERQVSAERLLRTRSTFSNSVMVSVAVSLLGTTELMFIEPGVKN